MSLLLKCHSYKWRAMREHLSKFLLSSNRISANPNESNTKFSPLLIEPHYGNTAAKPS